MKTRFLLKRKKANPAGSHLIYIALYEGDQTELISTDKRINKADWSKDGLPKDQGGDIFNAIEKVRASVRKAEKMLEINDQPITPFTVKQKYLDNEKQKKEANLTGDERAKAGLKSIYSLAKTYKENLPDKFSKATKTTVAISIDQFMQYLDKVGKRSIELKDLSDTLIEDYGKYLLEKRKLANSTHNKRMKHLNWFLKSIGFKATIKPRKQRRKAIIALTVKELRALEEVNVSKASDEFLRRTNTTREFLQRSKEMFLLGCYTALRISDLKRINPTNSAGGFISLTTQKNNEVFRMPIMSQAQAILDKNGGRAPRISEQEVNRSIKAVCELAKINQEIELEYSKGGRDLIKKVRKYEVISSHIAGKTFITNAKELWGLEPAEVAGIVRKDLKTMLNHYFKPPVESATLKMINADLAQMKIAK